MANEIPSPLINGQRYDFSSIDFRANGTTYTLALQDLNYDTNLEPGDVRGARSKVIGDTTGVQKDTASFTLLDAEGRQLLADLGDGYGKKKFNVVIQKDDGNGRTTKDELVLVRIKKPTFNPGKVGSSDPATVKFDLWVTDVKIDGKSISGNDNLQVG